MRRQLSLSISRAIKAQDGERKVPARTVVSRRGSASAWLCALLVCLLGQAPAQASERIISHPTHQLALFGYDAVAYYADMSPRIGSPDYEILHNGLVWRFANEGNLESFLENPDAFLPAYGGHGALMMARGVVAPGHPEVSMVLGGRVFLFRDIASRYAFLLEAEHSISRADGNWPDIRETLAP